MTATAETNLNYVHNGRQSLKLAYDTSDTGTASLAASLTVPANESYLGVWVYGDNSGNTLTATVTDGSGQTSSMAITALNFTGWKHVVTALPANTATVCTLSVVYGGGENASTGTLWLDHFTTSNENISDTTPPVIKLSLSGNQLSATVTDDMDRSIPAENVTVTYDGTPVEKSWNAASGALSATLPAADGYAHRVTVEISDASGNLARASADVAPSAANQNVFTDMNGHWAALYATYLYRSGITQGTGGDGAPLVYSPDRNISRAEFFALVARWLGLDLTASENVTLPFADTDQIPSWALSEIKAMYATGILSGSDVGGVLYANPNANITRAEAIAILGRTQAKGYASPELTATDAASVPGWALSYMEILSAQGVVSGYNGLISPNASITRAEVAVLLYKMI